MKEDRPTPGKVLVTGATGFVGKAIVRTCLKTGFDVVPVGNSRGQEPDWPDYVRADLTQPNALSSVLNGVHCVIHSAGLAHQFDKSQANASFRKINADTVEHVAISAAKAGVEHFVLISSVAVYGSGENPNEESPCDPRGAYAASKLEGEKRATEICTSAKMRLTIVRLTTAYGEGDPGNVRRLMQTIDSGRFVFIGTGANRKSLIHVDDVAGACALVVNSCGSGVEIYNLTSGAYTMREIVEGIADALGRRAPRMFVPSPFILLPLSAAAKCVPRLAPLKTVLEKWLADDIFDGSKFVRDFKFQPVVNLREGLKREADWLRKAAEQRRTPAEVREKT
jgi:nucleoside-diphosphate-sugar epimerase